MLAFGVGASLPLAALGHLSRERLLRLCGLLASVGSGAKTVFGAGLVVIGVLILAGYD